MMCESKSHAVSKGVKPNTGRRLFHLLATLLIPVLSLVIPRDALLPFVWAVVGSAIVAELVRFSSARLNSLFLRFFGGIVRPAEATHTTSATYVALSTAVCFTTLPYPIAMAAVCFLATGDAAAGMVGERWGRIKLFREKTLQGSLAFLIAALAAGMLWRLMTPSMSLPTMVAGVIVASVVELLPLPFDDNLSIPIVSGLTMALLST